MKINQDVRITELQKQVSAKQATMSPSFKSAMEKEKGRLQADQLTKLLSDIEEFGKRLAKSRNFKDLARFKGLVKRFVKEAVESGLSLEESRSFDLYGNSRTLTIVKELDTKLIQLTEDLLNKEQDSVLLLERIGEIKGLLINLYT
ncbi:YaaR family protein [Bacillus gobiensis]|uniref:YaaR family protein n=1 Tax=Bacillus gobiensis TaxID=1441095 RepID=UPI003D22E3EA